MEAQHRHPVTVLAMVVLVGMIIVGTGCTPSVQRAPNLVTVAADGGEVSVDGVTVTVPPGSAPNGSKLSLDLVDEAMPHTGPTTGVHAVSRQGIEIELDAGSTQPTKPIRLTQTLDPAAAVRSDGKVVDDSFLLIIRSADGRLDAVEADWDEKASRVSALLPHLSVGWFAQLDVGKLMSEVRQSILQSLNLEYPEPACVGDSVSLPGGTYSAVQPSQAWVCLRRSDDGLLVRVEPNSALPFKIRTRPASRGWQTAEVAAGSALLAALLGRSEDRYTAAGVGAEFQFTGSPTVRMEFRQDPPIQLVQILVKVVEVVVGPIKALKKLGELECFGGVLSAAGSASAASQVAATVKAFFPCVASAIDLTPPAAIILAILGSGPQLLVSSVVGILNELAGTAHFAVDLAPESVPTKPTEKPTKKPAPPNATSLTLGRTAEFEHFSVTASKLWYTTGHGLLVKARVCVKKLPPDPQGKTTRISWDPWSVQVSGNRVRPKLFDGSHPPEGMFASEGLHRVGSCAVGWIPFSAVTEPGDEETVRYANGLGDVAIWKAGSIEGRPRPSTKRVSWTYPAPFIPNNDEEFSSETLDGPTANFDATADFHSVYQMRNFRWEGWGSATATGKGRVRLCADTCDEWRQVSIELSNIKGIECGDNEPFSYYTRYRLTGFGSSDGDSLPSPAYC